MISQVCLLLNVNSTNLELVKNFCHNTIPTWENSMIIALGISNNRISLKPVLDPHELKNLAKKMSKNSSGLKLDDFYSSNNIISDVIVIN